MVDKAAYMEWLRKSKRPDRRWPENYGLGCSGSVNCVDCGGVCSQDTHAESDSDG